LITWREPALPASSLLKASSTPSCPDVLHVGEARQVRGRLALGVLAPVVAAQVEALDAEIGDLLADGGVDLALDPDEALVLVLELLVELLLRHAEQLGGLLQLGLHGGVVALDVLGNGPDAGRRNVGGEDQPVAVEDAPAVRGQLQRALVAHLALVLEEVVVEDLHVGGPAGQQHEAEGDAGHDELAAPDGGGAGEQRTAAVADAAGGIHEPRLSSSG
jgi:hypothetical protein